MEKDDEGKGNEESKVINPKILCKALLSVCSVEKVDKQNAEAIAMATLLPAHHPYLGNYKVINKKHSCITFFL